MLYQAQLGQDVHQFSKTEKNIVPNKVKEDGMCSLPLQIKSLCRYITSDPPIAASTGSFT